jgi:nuclear transport factor 2 (NTF2) superfamily protein
MLPAEPSDEQLDRLAERIVELLSLRFAAEASQQLVDAQAIATEFGISRKWVYEYADALGAIRVGNGRKRRLRFDRAVVRERIATVGSLPALAAPRRSRRRASTPAGRGLLPIRGRRAAE